MTLRSMQRDEAERIRNMHFTIAESIVSKEEEMTDRFEALVGTTTTITWCKEHPTQGHSHGCPDCLVARLAEAEALLRGWVPEYDCGSFCGGDCKRSQLLDRTRAFLEAK